MDSLNDSGDTQVTINDAAGAGSTKRKELHGTINVRALSGSWVNNTEGAVFHVYRIAFTCNIADMLYPEFVLLTESKLDHDVGTAKVDLYLLDKMVYSSVSPSGEVHLASDQIWRAMRFHELLFNGLFGKLFKGSKASGVQREFLLQSNDNLLWTSSYMYLILPLESPSNMDHDSWGINWKGIDSCVSVINFMKNNAWLNAELSERNNELLNVSSSSENDNQNIMDLHLANRSCSVSDLKDTVVMAIHTGRIYYVVDVLDNTSAESSFDANAGKATSKYSSYADYFNKKYEIVLSYPGQPLLLLKQTHNPFNLLIDNETIASYRKVLSNAGDKSVAEKPQNHVQIPPELLVIIDIPVSILRAFYLIPSLMHRMETLMLASQLREEIAFNLSNFHIRSSLVLEALTTLRCCEEFSSERLELLGDSVLKYAVSCHVFLNHPHKHEGELSDQRQKAVCNATLHELGANRRLQEYIRDSAFEPRRWVAPGQLSLNSSPCSHGVDTSEVPVDSRYHSIDETIILGKSCDMGHRWMVSKSISDCVEALIGAYYVDGGLVAAIHVMNWLGIEVKLEPSCVDRAINLASDRSYTHKADEILALESKVGYNFSTKGLLLEAITFATEKEVGLGYCYERLEFLGDAVLDLVITWYLYQSHRDIDPGELTDLRSASVNNESFAQVAVRRNLYQHFQNCSGPLWGQITEYAKLVMDAEDDASTLQGRQFPKALGDLVESIAGAILIDTKLNVEQVWKIYEPLLSPIATPDNLELPPFRELTELCDHLGYFYKEHFVDEKDMVRVELRLQLRDVFLIGEGTGKTKKLARGQAACHLLNDLEKRGVSKSRKRESLAVSSVSGGKRSVEPGARKKQKTSRLHQGNSQGSDGGTPVIAAVNKDKGGPRMSLYELCKRLQWPMPSFEATEEKSRYPIEFGEGANKRVGFNSYVSKISLHIPDSGAIEATGDPRPDKKSSQDSAALHLLYKLEELGKLVIGCS